MPHVVLVALLTACSPPPLDEGLVTPWELPLEAAGPPVGWLTLSAGPLVAGAPLQLHVAGAPPRSTVLLARSAAGLGPGPCPEELQGGCLGLLDPVTYLSLSARADGSGNATFRTRLPAALAGQRVTLQAAVAGREAWLSNPIDRVVAPAPFDAAVDGDGDGVTALAGDCAEGRADIHPGAADPLGDGRDLDCNDLDGATERIPADAAGGTWQLANGGSLTLPPGALSGPTVLEVIPIHPPSWMAAAGLAPGGAAVRLGPDGLQLAAPLTLRLPFAPPTRPDAEPGLGFSADRLRGAARPATFDRGAALVLAELPGPGEAAAAQVLDGDGDGAVDLAAGGTDCDDRDPRVHPNAAEICGNGDQDCDGEDERYLALDGTGAAGCAVDHRGAVSCWGTALTPPAGGPFDAVRHSHYEICARTLQGMWTCEGQIGVPDGDWRELALDGENAVTLDRAGQLHLWGGGFGSPPAEDFIDVDIGGYIVCAITTAQALVCFEGGQVTPPALAPTTWLTGTFTRVAMSRDGSAAALSSDGDLSWWPGGHFTSPARTLAGPFVAPSLCMSSGPTAACGVDASGGYTCSSGRCGAQAAALLVAQDDGGCTLGVDGALRCYEAADHPPALRQPVLPPDPDGAARAAVRLDGTVWTPLGDSSLARHLTNLPLPALRLVSWTYEDLRLCALTEAGEIGCGTDMNNHVPPRMLEGGPFDAIFTWQEGRTDALCGHAVATDTWACTGDHPEDLLAHLQPGDAAPVSVHDNACGRTCVLDTIGRLRCWDHSYLGPDTGTVTHDCLEQPPGGVFKAVGATSFGAIWVGLRPSGEVVFWGGTAGLLPPPHERASAIAAGFDACLADAAGVWRCWDSAAGGWRTDVPSVPLHAVGDGPRRGQMCGLDASGHQRCWGRDPSAPRVCDPPGW